VKHLVLLAKESGGRAKPARLLCGVASAALGLALVLVLAAPALASERHPTQGELEAELVCPTCHTPLDESNSPVAQQMKAYVRRHIALGWTKSRIENALVAQLGPEVLGVPQTHGFDLLAWVLPLGGVVLGALALGGATWAWSRNRPGDNVPPGTSGALGPELEQRVDEELARFDG
jgi:cytochrome c-type biogenesis protein CcmH